VTSWYINESDLGGLVGEIMSRSVGFDLPTKPDVSFQLQLPNEWDPDLARVNVGLSAFVETDICNPHWIECCSKMDQVIVPSRHVKETVDRTGTVSPSLKVIPESFMDEVFLPEHSLTLEGVTTSFNFLVVGQITGNSPENDRKNTYQTIKWLCESFKDDPTVGIIVKTNSGTSTTIDRGLTAGNIKSLVKSVRKGPFPRVYLIHGNMTEGEVASLYRRPDVKALVNLTRGEGYGLPLLEAAASDLPVIATNWSGHLDFLSCGKFIPVNYELKEIPASRVDGQIFMKGSRWAEVIEADFKKKIKKFRDSPDIPKGWARDMGKVIRERYSRESIDRIYTETLGHLCNSRS
jgi:glycosyltransferase involved in cell wall biosynthesis